MSEPYLPVPPPEDNSTWEPEPARCMECGSIVDVIRKGDRTFGFCSADGEVDIFYSTGVSQVPEKGDAA